MEVTEMPMNYNARQPGEHNLGPTSYSPRKLILDVIAMLEDRGLTPQLDTDPDTARETLTSAHALLRGIGVSPAAAPEDVLDLDGGARYSSRMHGD
jgi:hypothetical protein